MPGYILTGAPGARKTAVLRLLEVNGHVVVEEAATDTIGLDNALGHEEPWHDHAFIDKVVALQRQRQNSIRTAETAAVFFDRSPVGVVAFGEAEARETVNPRFGQVAKVSSSKAAAIRRVAVSSTPSS